MRIKVAAAAPEIIPGRPGQNMANVLAAISRARADGASLLVLPAGLPEDMNPGALERQAGPMTVYPLTRASLSREELMGQHDLDVLCCSAGTPSTATSYFENDELAAAASHENMAVVVMACPRGGDGGQIYTGQCVIAQNGKVLESADGYAIAQVTVPSKQSQPPVEGIVTEQTITPWTPLPEMLPRVLYLQADALSRRMIATGATHLAVDVGRSASSLLALAVCAEAVDLLKLSRKNIHATVTGNRATQIAMGMGVSIGTAQGALAVDSTDLTARAVEGAAPEHYTVNATVPRSTIQLVMRHYANTCGDMNLSVPIRSIIHDDPEPWELYDFLLHFTLIYNLPKWGAARLLEDTFQEHYKMDDIRQVLDRFFDNYRRLPPADGPAVFSLEPKTTIV